jgi:hypothetical protein
MAAPRRLLLSRAQGGQCVVPGLFNAIPPAYRHNLGTIHSSEIVDAFVATGSLDSVVPLSRLME